MQPLAEKRKFDRFEFQKSVQVFPVLPSKSGHIYEVQHQPIDAWANDISQDGLRLEVSRSFDPNFLLKLNFEFEKDKAVEVFGQIVWSHDNHSGVRFLSVDRNLRRGIKAIHKKKKS